MSLLSLAHFTVIDADPLALIDVGAAAGFDAVGLRIVLPPGAPPITPVIGDPALQRAIRERLDATGLQILDTEAIWLQPETEIAALQPVIDTSVALGARFLIVCSNDPHRARALTRFAQLCERAASAGIRVMLEFLPYTQLRSLPEAHHFLSEAAPTNAGILVDALHLSRSRGSPADLAAYDPGLFSLAHLCDAPLAMPPPDQLRAEARTGRLPPGEGALWLDAFVQAFPPETAFAVEAPAARYAALTPAARAAMVANASRRFVPAA